MRLSQSLFVVVLLTKVDLNDVLRRLFAPTVGGQAMKPLLASKLLAIQNGGIIDVEME